MKKRKIIILIVLSMILVAEGVLYFTSSSLMQIFLKN